jgi:hypothetical protein
MDSAEVTPEPDDIPGIGKLRSHLRQFSPCVTRVTHAADRLGAGSHYARRMAEPHDETVDDTADTAPLDDYDTDTPADVANRLEAYDLDGDGEIGLVEDARARLGMVDARLEELAEEGGVKGKLADAAHHVVDRIDND